MSHAKQKDEDVSLFPFMAVLLCTMGALLVILVGLSEQARVNAASARQPTPADQPPAVESPDAAQQEAARQRAEQRYRELLEIRAEAASRLSDARAKLSHIEEHTRRLHEALAVLEREADRLKSLEQTELADQEEAERELAALKAAIADAEAELEKVREDVANREKSFAIVPYEGPHGTQRRPIYIECREDRVVLQPEGVQLEEADFLGPLGPGNPLAAGVRAAVEYYANAYANEAGQDQQPYPLLLVRPDGIEMYYEVRRALASWGPNFGYELVDGDWQLEFPPANAQLANAQQLAIEMARARQRELAAAAPTRFLGAGGIAAATGSGSGGDAVWDSGDSSEDGWDDSGGETGPPSLYEDGGPEGPSRGGASAPISGSGTSGRENWNASGGRYGERDGGQTTAEFAGGDRVYPGGSAVGPAADGRPVEPQRGPYSTLSQPGDFAGDFSAGRVAAGAVGGGRSTAADGRATAAPGHSSGETASLPGSPSTGQQREGEPSGEQAGQPTATGQLSTSAGASNGEARGGPGGAASAGRAAGGGSAGGSQGTSAAEVAPIAATHGANWAVRGVPPDAVPVERAIQVVVRGDRIAILPERGNRGHELAIDGVGYPLAERFVTTLRTHMATWGTAGNGLYWRPVLVLRAGPEAKEVAAKLHTTAGTQRGRSPDLRSEGAAMKRGEGGGGDLPGQDSFLDIVANMVGILIILVMVAGVRAAYTPSVDEATSPQASDTPAKASEPELADLREVELQAQSLYHEVAEMTQQLLATEQEVAVRDDERVMITAHSQRFAEALEHERGKLDRFQREELRLRSAFAEAERKLSDLDMERIALEAAPDDVQVVESLPTPIASTVHGEELHLRLARGRVAVIPMERLLDQVRQDAEARLWHLKEKSTFTGTVGPVEGFRLRYQFARHSVRSRGPDGNITTGTVARLVRFELLPVEEDLGEPFEQALMPGSALMTAIREAPAGRTTITCWTYSDSFSQFRGLKQELFERGYSTAARPLMPGLRIGASIHGSRSVAQ